MPPRKLPIIKILMKIKRLARRLVKIELDPEMQMNPYNVNELLFFIQSQDIRNLYVEFTDHGGELGVFLYFQKPKQA